MQLSGAAAWVFFSDLYNTTAGFLHSTRGKYSPDSGSYSMPFFDAGNQLDHELLQSIRFGMGSGGRLQLALRTRQESPPLAEILEAPWFWLCMHCLPSMALALCTLLAAAFFW